VLFLNRFSFRLDDARTAYRPLEYGAATTGKVARSVSGTVAVPNPLVQETVGAAITVGRRALA
jgi:hypothetical protein